jgi:hypothetical protein
VFAVTTTWPSAIAIVSRWLFRENRDEQIITVLTMLSSRTRKLTIRSRYRDRTTLCTAILFAGPMRHKRDSTWKKKSYQMTASKTARNRKIYFRSVFRSTLVRLADKSDPIACPKKYARGCTSVNIHK